MIGSGPSGVTQKKSHARLRREASPLLNFPEMMVMLKWASGDVTGTGNPSGTAGGDHLQCPDQLCLDLTICDRIGKKLLYRRYQVSHLANASIGHGQPRSSQGDIRKRAGSMQGRISISGRTLRMQSKERFDMSSKVTRRQTTGSSRVAGCAQKRRTNATSPARSRFRQGVAMCGYRAREIRPNQAPRRAGRTERGCHEHLSCWHLGCNRRTFAVWLPCSAC